MAGYSGSPLGKKLGIREGSAVGIRGALVRSGLKLVWRVHLR